VDIVKVKHGLVSLCGGDCLNVDLKIGVKPFIRKEWGDICGRVRGIVVCKLCEREEAPNCLVGNRHRFGGTAQESG
jgi:hypothetical protein